MLDFCLLHYLLSSHSKAMTLHKVYLSIHHFTKLLTKKKKKKKKKKKTKLVLYWIKGNNSRFGSAIHVLPSDIGKYFSSFFIPVVVVISIFICNWKRYFFNIVNPCVRKKVYLLLIYHLWCFAWTYLTSVINMKWLQHNFIPKFHCFIGFFIENTFVKYILINQEKFFSIRWLSLKTQFNSVQFLL